MQAQERTVEGVWHPELFGRAESHLLGSDSSGSYSFMSIYSARGESVEVLEGDETSLARVAIIYAGARLAIRSIDAELLRDEAGIGTAIVLPGAHMVTLDFVGLGDAESLAKIVGEGGAATISCEMEAGRQYVIECESGIGVWKPVVKANGSTLFYAASHESEDEVAELLGTGEFDVNERDINGDGPLCAAVGSGNAEVVRLLLERGACATAANDTGWTALHVAAMIGDEEIAQLLIAGGADLGARTRTGQTPVDIARYWAEQFGGSRRVGGRGEKGMDFERVIELLAGQGSGTQGGLGATA
jgi:hypothetical protein